MPSLLHAASKPTRLALTFVGLAGVFMIVSGLSRGDPLPDGPHATEEAHLVVPPSLRILSFETIAPDRAVVLAEDTTTSEILAIHYSNPYRVGTSRPSRILRFVTEDE